MTLHDIAWQAPEFEYRPKGIVWYWTSMGVALLVLIFAVSQRNFLFGFFVVAAEILILVWAPQKPPLREFAIKKEGMGIGEQKIFPWDGFETFGIDEGRRNEWPTLVFAFRRKLRPPLRISFPKERRSEIETALKIFLPQSEPESSIFEDLENFLRF